MVSELSVSHRWAQKEKPPGSAVQVALSRMVPSGSVGRGPGITSGNGTMRPPLKFADSRLKPRMGAAVSTGSPASSEIVCPATGAPPASSRGCPDQDLASEEPRSVNGEPGP